jgi:uridine phosphorylase
VTELTSYPILEFDSSPKAIVEPQIQFELDPSIKGGVLCFFQEVLSGLLEHQQLRVIGELRSEMGSHPIYVMDINGYSILIFHPGVGAPLAAGFLEELIAMGVQKFIVCGGCGVLDPDLEPGSRIILTAAVRDEGTSYHYLPPQREVIAQGRPIKALEDTLHAFDLPYILAKTWTTDALYRETTIRRHRRFLEGCQVVEMEAAALMAVAQFRHVELGQIVYAGDLVIPDGWDKRGWNFRKSDRTLLFEIAVDACIRLIQ